MTKGRSDLLPIPSATFDPLPEIEARIASGLRLHRRVPGLGFLHVERTLPFLAYCRREAVPANGTEKLVSTLPAYFLVDEAASQVEENAALASLGASLAGRAGAALLLEIRARSGDTASPLADGSPGFR